MNFEQARELSFLVKWKVAECFSGPSWCRRILPVDPSLYNDEYENFGKTLVSTEPEEYEIIPDAAIDQKTAEYIVRLHNENYDRVQQSCRDAMRDIEFVKLDLNEEQLENFKKEYDKLNKHSKIRTIKREEID